MQDSEVISAKIGSASRALLCPDGDVLADMRTERTVRGWAWSRSRRGLTTRSSSPEGLHVIACRGTLDVARELTHFVAKLLVVERHRRGSPRGSRRPVSCCR